MSGGYYDIPNWKLEEVANDIEDYIVGHELDEDELDNLKYDYQRGWLDKKDYDELLKTRHTEPNRYGFSEETIKHMKDAVKVIRMACVYINRFDYLMGSDDSEESFLTRLKEDLDKLNK